MYHNFSMVYIGYCFLIIWTVNSEPDNDAYSKSLYSTAPSTSRNESATNCQEPCGCDSVYIFNETISECVLNMEYVLNATLAQMGIADSVYKNEDHDISNDDGMAKRLRLEAQEVFRGIIISALIFVGCASVCAITACVYCCHINYSDRKLENDVKALAKKLKRNYNGNKSVRKAPLEPAEESCNVVVGSAGLYVV